MFHMPASRNRLHDKRYLELLWVEKLDTCPILVGVV